MSDSTFDDVLRRVGVALDKMESPAAYDAGARAERARVRDLVAAKIDELNAERARDRESHPEGARRAIREELQLLRALVVVIDGQQQKGLGEG